MQAFESELVLKTPRSTIATVEQNRGTKTSRRIHLAEHNVWILPPPRRDCKLLSSQE